MIRIVSFLLALGVVVSCTASAAAYPLGAVSAASLTTYSAASTVPTSACSSNPTQDATIDAQHKNSNNGTATTLIVASGSKPEYGLVQFTPCASANAAIVSASLQLRLTTAPSATRTYGLYQLLGSWAENTVTFSNAPTISGTVSSTQATGASGSTMQWPLTADVQAIVNGGANNGWAIEDNGATADTGTLSSREGATKPVLSLVYYP